MLFVYTDAHNVGVATVVDRPRVTSGLFLMSWAAIELVTISMQGRLYAADSQPCWDPFEIL